MKSKIEKRAPFARWRREWIRAGKPNTKAFFAPRMSRWLAKNLFAAPCRVTVSGPFGLACRYWADIITGNNRTYSLALELSLDDRDALWSCRRVDLAADESRYKEGTIGYLNGLQFRLDKPPGDPPVSWFRERLN